MLVERGGAQPGSACFSAVVGTGLSWFASPSGFCFGRLRGGWCGGGMWRRLFAGLVQRLQAMPWCQGGPCTPCSVQGGAGFAASSGELEEPSGTVLFWGRAVPASGYSFVLQRERTIAAV